MAIAIIGTGNMGNGLARALTAAGTEVVIGHRDPAKAAALAKSIGSRAQSGGIAAAFRSADVVVLAVPYQAATEVLAEAADVTGKVLVDLSNPVTADMKDLVVGHTTSAAEEIQRLAPNAKVVKAFNTIFSSLFPAEARASQRLQTFVAGDDAASKGEVVKLATAVGLDAVDAGPLSNARFLEPIGEMNIHLGLFLGLGTAIAPAWIKL